MQRVTFTALFLALSVLLAGCVPKVPTQSGIPQQPPPSTDEAVTEDDKIMEGETSVDVSGSIEITPPTNQAPPASQDAEADEPETVSTYTPFSVTAYNQARAANRPIFLYFYANWCPTCRVQEPIMQELFASGEVPGGVAAFRVNYADTDTDDAEKALADQLGVTYQHTFFMFNSSGQQVGKNFGHRSRAQLLTDIQAGI